MGVKMKCATCDKELTTKKMTKQIKVTLSNPGDVICKGKIIRCKCGEEYAEGEDIFAMARSFDEEYLKKHGSK